MNALRIALAIFAGFVGAVLTEVLSFVAMNVAPSAVDLTGNFFVSVLIPVVLCVHVAMALAFWKAFEPNPLRNPLLFIASHAVFQSAELATFGNPTRDILIYVAIIVVSGTLVSWVFRRYFWCPACLPPPG
jgi:hypothetical protein